MTMEVTHTEKAYCCSNYPQTEATLIAKFELVLAAIWLITLIILFSVAISTTSSSNQVAGPNVTSDPTMIYRWPRDRQIVYLSCTFVFRIVGLGFSIVLFLGVKRRHHGYLLTWFIHTVIFVIFSILYGLVTVINSGDKLFLSTYFIGSFLYNWYVLWIVKLLMSEVRAVREGYANPLDDADIEHANNLVPNSDSFTVDKF